MSKARSRKQHSHKQDKSHKKKKASSEHRQRRLSKVLPFVIIAVLVAIPFGMGKYFEFNSPGAYDSGAYVYSAAHIVAGAEIGVEEKTSAQIGTLMVNMLGVRLFGYNEIGPELIQTILQAAALVLMFVAMRKLFGMIPAGLGVLLAAIYLSSPLIAKFGNVKEQYMIACMISGMSCFVLYQLGGKWFWAVLAGAFLIWAPLFKPTGTSAIGGVGIFVIAQPLLKHRTFKQTGVDIVLLLAGAAGALAPLFIWILAWDVKLALPYAFAWKTIAKMLPSTAGSTAAAGAGAAKSASGYLARSRELVPFSEQWPRVLRYYGLMILPIALAVSAILVRVVKMIWDCLSKSGDKTKATYDRFVLLFAIWWILDMAFVWISPRSYEQYYLPLNASAAMLGGYVVALYRDRLTHAVYKGKWVIGGAVALVLMVVMSWHVFFGISKSPHSGRKYGRRIKGYAQKFDEISARRKSDGTTPWENVGRYIRAHSDQSDTMYVWGWYPGIYVVAQRFSPTTPAFMMPRSAPSVFAQRIEQMLKDFRKNPPKFIVDSRKRHIPTNRPPYELWPIAPRGFQGVTKAHFVSPGAEADSYDKLWAGSLRNQFGDDEADRYEAMKPLRDFIMANYEPAEPQYFRETKSWQRLLHRMFGEHVVFRLKDSATARGS